MLSPEQLTRYADAVVLACLRLERGDLLYVHAQPAHRELAVALAEAAFRAGAADANVDYVDNHVAAARLRHAADEHLGRLPAWRAKLLREELEPEAANVTIIGEGDPGAFDGVLPARLAADTQQRAAQMQWFQRAVKAGRYRWTGCAWPTPHWAGQVYPELPTEQAMKRLADDILWFCRLGPTTPPARRAGRRTSTRSPDAPRRSRSWGSGGSSCAGRARSSRLPFRRRRAGWAAARRTHAAGGSRRTSRPRRALRVRRRGRHAGRSAARARSRSAGG